MFRTMLKSKIHRATVTGIAPDVVPHSGGSVTVDAALMEAADLLEGEQVTVVDVTGGARLQTYVLTGERDSGVLDINGTAAQTVQQGNLVVLLAYGVMDEQETRSHRPRVVFVDNENRIVEQDRGSDDLAVVSVSAVMQDGDSVPAETDDAAKLDALLQQPET